MKKNVVTKVLPIAFLVAFLVGLLSFSTCSSGGSTEQEGAGTVSEDPQYAVQIHVDCESSPTSSKYDVDVKVDGNKVGNIDHGGEATLEASLTKGQHELVFVEEGHTSPNGQTSFVVEGEGDKFSYQISCTEDQIEIKLINDKTEAQADGNAADGKAADTAEEGSTKDDAVEESSAKDGVDKGGEPERGEGSTKDAAVVGESGKSGVFEYAYVGRSDVETQDSYDVYFLFDEDAHVAVVFTSDAPEDVEVWPYSGNFNDGVELDLIDSGEVIAHWHVRWNTRDSPETLIVTDDDFEFEYEQCSESEALSYFSNTMWEKVGL